MDYKVLAFDFDAVITQYRGAYRGDTLHEQPNPEVVSAITTLRAQGYKIIIHSTKSTATIAEYCAKHGVPYDYINENPEIQQGNPGKPRAGAYIDDRAVNFHNQTAEELVREINAFDTYYKKSSA